MENVKGIASSTKRMGKYEKDLIDKLTFYFHENEYKVFPHSSLNIAWGSILSDIDLLLIKDNYLIYVEVKSKRDKISSAIKQIERRKDYIDYAYVATNKSIKDWAESKIGLILIKEDIIKITKEPSRFTNGPSFSSIFSLKKKCLNRFLTNGEKCKISMNKYDLARYVWTVRKSICTRDCLKEIVTCGNTCDTYCPIVTFIEIK